MTYRTLYKLFKFKRQGASLVNVCVFFLAATMIMAQVFFFSTTTSETLAEEAKSVGRRFSMGQKLELAFKNLKDDSIIPSGDISPDKISFYSSSGGPAGVFKSFYPTACAWSNDKDVKDIYIYNLNYTLFERYYANVDDSQKWDDAVKTPHKLIFPPMGAGYFLVRVLAPGQGLGKKLMYQVLTRRSVKDMYSTRERYTVEPLTFQEVWYE